MTRSGTEVLGVLDLRQLGTIRQQFICRHCTFEGDVKASGVAFLSTLDLSGSTFDGSVDFSQASFQGPVLFGTPPAPSGENTVFEQGARFTLARFDDIATFEHAVFVGGSPFTLTRFGADAIFAEANFEQPASFERALFSGPADFRQGKFRAGVNFERARFAQRADLSASHYWGTAHAPGTADFREARFASDADFQGATFAGGNRSSAYSASFESSTSGGSFNFQYARFQYQASFSGMASTGAISLANATFPAKNVIVMDGIDAGGLFIAVPDVLGSVQSTDQRSVLALLESTAQARGDLNVANDALYAKRTLISDSYPPVERILDVIFYRTIAGYLVRPLRPLVALLTFAAAMTLIRLAPRTRPQLHTVHLRQTLGAGNRFLHRYLDTLTLVGRNPATATAPGVRLETLAYRILIVCALFGLANSNPTLRQMIDALH